MSKNILAQFIREAVLQEASPSLLSILKTLQKSGFEDVEQKTGTTVVVRVEGGGKGRLADYKNIEITPNIINTIAINTPSPPILRIIDQNMLN